MAASRHDRVERLFDTALGKDPKERAAYLDGIADLDPELRREVESLLASHDANDDEAADEATAIRPPSSSGESAERIGPYRILRKIGEGGMGLVYEAEQERPVRRKVALKLIKWGMDTKEVVARFESERQALALMSHPNIASVFDAGATEAGRPYFAMELVRGEPITQYCDKNLLTIEERLDLFAQVCAGVQHAHQKGIIHRDIKPSNILITIQDDEPVPKIIDFGIAKATSQRLTEKTVYTELGQLIGTPEYMSPEQAEMTAIDIDTRTDVYSLGVVLYELLVGAQPFDPKILREANFDDMRRTVREAEPPKPSTRLGRLGEPSTTAAKNRRVETGSLVRALQGDLDWITMKALEKDRTRRYGSPSDLAADIRRHLKDEPVEASPPSQLYRMQKFVRRHRVAVAAAMALAVAVIGFGVVMAVQSARIARERSRAEDEAAKATAINAFLLQMLDSANPLTGIGEDVTVLEAIDRAAEEIDDSFPDQPMVAAAARDAIGMTYVRLGRHDDAESLLLQNLETRRRMLGAEHPDTLDNLTALGLLAMERGDLDLAERFLQDALTGYQQSHPEDVDLGAIILNLAGVAERRGDWKAGESWTRDALEHYRQAEDPVAVAWALSALGFNLNLQQRWEEAETTYRDALARRRSLYTAPHPLIAMTLHGLGNALAHQHGSVLRPSGNCEEAVTPYREAATTYRDTMADSRGLAGVLQSLGSCLVQLRQYENAEEILLESVELLSTAPLSDEYVRRADRRLLYLYESWEKPDQAAKYRKLLEPEPD